jgi:hypothetical protein
MPGVRDSERPRRTILQGVRRRSGASVVTRVVRLFSLLGAIVLLTTAAAAQMPDVRQMSGIPMPSGDVPGGTIVVRVVRGDLGNNVAHHPVELHAGDRVIKADTDENGRATFSGLTAGTDAHAITTVDGERLETGHMAVDGAAGLRVLLVAGAGASAPAANAASPAALAAEPVAGDVVLGGQSRIQIEFEDDALTVFYLFEVINRGSAPVNPARELTFELPADAQSPAALEGSAAHAQIRGKTILLAGPFAPGATPVQVAFGLPGGSASRVISQVLPVNLEQVQVLVPQVGSVQVASAQLTNVSPMANGGASFVLGTGPSLAAGKAFTLSLTGLPVRNRTGRWVSIVLAVIVLLAGAWAAFGGTRRSPDDARRAELDSRRQKLLADLARIDQERRTAGDTPALVSTRQAVMAQLERVYGELDQHGAAAGLV